MGSHLQAASKIYMEEQKSKKRKATLEQMGEFFFPDIKNYYKVLITKMIYKYRQID